MVADLFRFRLFPHVCPHGGQNFCGKWKVWRKTSATHSSASRPRSTPGWLLHLEIQFCLDLKRLNKNCFRRFLQILDCFEKMDFDYQMFTCSSEEQAPMAPTRASRSTPPLEHQPYCRFEYFCKNINNIPNQLNRPNFGLFSAKVNPFFNYYCLSFARYIEPIYFAQINFFPRILVFWIIWGGRK